MKKFYNITLKFDITVAVAPMLYNDKTLVPIRFISESLGATVEWNQETQTAYINLI